MSFSILGTGKAVPEYVLTNDELSTMVETSDEWISTRTGIKKTSHMQRGNNNGALRTGSRGGYEQRRCYGKGA